MTQHTDNQILLYEVDSGETRVEVLYEGETVWLTQKQMAELFDTDQSGIARHIKNIYETDELVQESTMQKVHNARSTKPVQYYNLDMIISVGYRVNSRRGTHFRIWTTKTLREYIIKGFVVDDERLENGGSNYFDELEERVRRIRTSEQNFYRKVLDIFSTSIDYNSKSQDAKTFFATVQNKFHYAIHGKTAAELITGRIDSMKDHMGLTTWYGEIVKTKDAVVAKNYLTALELKQLELLVEQFLSYAELQVVEKRLMYMGDWVGKLDAFIIFNEKDVLTSAGQVSRKKMKRYAHNWKRIGNVWQQSK
ncbi:MAG: RhuM family protein [Aggregatilineales bacterium]